MEGEGHTTSIIQQGVGTLDQQPVKIHLPMQTGMEFT